MKDVLLYILLGKAVKEAFDQLEHCLEKQIEEGNIDENDFSIKTKTIEAVQKNAESGKETGRKFSFAVSIESNEEIEKLAAFNFMVKSKGETKIVSLDDVRGYECDCSGCQKRRKEQEDFNEAEQIVEQIKKDFGSL